jgi:hypothetical protein
MEPPLNSVDGVVTNPPSSHHGTAPRGKHSAAGNIPVLPCEGRDFFSGATLFPKAATRYESGASNR